MNQQTEADWDKLMTAALQLHRVSACGEGHYCPGCQELIKTARAALRELIPADKRAEMVIAACAAVKEGSEGRSAPLSSPEPRNTP